MFQTDNIAILLATYNGEKYIHEQIESILSQTYSEWEIYIHDDGSKDNTCEIILEYSHKYPEKIHIIEGAGTGCAKKNFFYLMSQVQAPYYMCCDQDDVWLETKIEKTIKKMKELEDQIGKQNPILVFSDLEVVDSNLNLIAASMNAYQKLNPSKTQFKDLLIQSLVTGCVMMMNESCVKKSLVSFDIDKIIMHDWWCSLVASYFGKIGFVDESLIKYRQHSDNSVGVKALSDIRYIIKKAMKGKEVKDTLRLTRNQAKEFVKAYELKDNCLADRYSRLAEEGKLKRIIFYMKNHMWKSGLARNAGLIIWG